MFRKYLMDKYAWKKIRSPQCAPWLIIYIVPSSLNLKQKCHVDIDDNEILKKNWMIPFGQQNDMSYIIYNCCDVISVQIICRHPYEEHTVQYVSNFVCSRLVGARSNQMPNPDSKVHWAYMGPTWGWQNPGGPHVDPMNHVIREVSMHSTHISYSKKIFIWSGRCVFKT